MRPRLLALVFFTLRLPGATPIPHIKGPLPETADSYAFGAAAHTLVPTDIVSAGYVEEEFIISGTANVYDWPGPGPAVVRTAGVPYATRVIVRRPAQRARFSGTVAVEMLNPSNLVDLNIGWAISHKQFIRRGDAWVGITAKPVAAKSLQSFNPVRYADLNWSNPLPLADSRNCATVARDSDRATENGLVWDMFSQTAAWLRSREPSNPLAGAVRHLYAWGYSQTGSYLYTYVNAIHPLDIKANGKPLYDGYLIAVAAAPTPINQCAGPLPEADPRRRITDAGVPVVHIMSQSDYLRAVPARRPDSDTPPDLFRHYEIAGMAHATPDELNFSASSADIVKAGHTPPAMSCKEGPRSRFPNSLAFNAAFQNLDLWVRKGIPPPRAEPITVKEGQPVLDRFGNVTGGVRSPFVDVPASTWFGNSTGESFCFLAGHEAPFDAARLRELYPTHASYARAVSANVNKLVALRFLTREDGDQLIAQAQSATLP